MGAFQRSRAGVDRAFRQSAKAATGKARASRGRVGEAEMCNLYTVRKNAEDVAAHFGAEVPKPIEMRPDTAKGGRGIVVRAQNGRRLVQEVGWGFPRLTREMREKNQPATPVNLVAD